MNSDQVIQEKKALFTATMIQNKLLLKVDDRVTYVGQIEASPYFDLKQVKQIFQSGKIEILCKTTSRMSIKLGFLKIQLQSEENRQIQQLQKRIKQLQDKIKAQPQSIEQDLTSTDKFELNCIYLITCGSATYISSYVSQSTLSFVYSGGAVYTTSNTNRKSNTGFGNVTRMIKHKR